MIVGRKRTKILAFLIAMAFLLASLPVSTALTPLVRAFTPEAFRHTPPQQSLVAFSGGPIDSIANPNFYESAPSVFSNSVPGWNQERSSGRALGGVVNMFRYDEFISSNNLENLSFTQTLPPTDFTDINFLVMTNRSENEVANVGFTSQDIEFYAGGYFIVEVDFYAVASNNAVYLLSSHPLTQDIDTSIQIHQIVDQYVDDPNASAWRTASFFVRTDAREAVSMQLGLYLGTRDTSSRGIVFYNNVRVWETTQGDFETRLEDEQDRNNIFIREIDLRQHDEKTDEYDFGNFVRAFDRQTDVHMNTSIMTPNVPNTLNFEDVNFLWGHSGGHAHDVMLLAAHENYASLQLETPFTIERNLVYMISFYSLGNASIRTRDTREVPTHLQNTIQRFDSGHIPTITQPESNRNNWSLNTFFVLGAVLEDIELEIEFWIGEDGVFSTGWILIDDFSIVRISNEYFESNRHDLHVFYLTQRDEAEAVSPINNSHFNFGTINNVNTPFPLRATGWTHTYGEESLVLSGIVNTQDTHWARFASLGGASNYGNAINPGPIGGFSPNNNIYMLQNRGNTWQRLESNEFALERGVYNIIRFDMAKFVPHVGDTMTLYAVIDFGGREISRINLSHTPLTPLDRFVPWQPFSFAIRDSEFTSRSVSISFIMGTEETESAPGIVFIDNMSVTTRDTINQSEVNAYANLGNPVTFEIDGESMFFVPDATGQANATVFNNILRIQTNQHQHTTVSNTLTEELQGGMFFEYQITLRIIPGTGQAITYERIPHFNTDGFLMDEPDDIDYGITFRLDGFDGGFVDMKPYYLNRMATYHLAGDGTGFWTTISFFIHSEATMDLSLVVEFGNEWRAVWAEVEIASINLVQIDEDAFNNARRNIDYDAHHRVVTEADRTLPPIDPEPDPTRRDGQLDFLIIPSIIMALALIFALVAFSLRRFKFKRHISKKHTSYANDEEFSVRSEK
ncbi:MAG: hypothetical protein FWE16_00625 [Firmicutes bacterium]|nr:hypothetical protein [Bacillota bacterium]